MRVLIDNKRSFSLRVYSLIMSLWTGYGLRLYYYTLSSKSWLGDKGNLGFCYSLGDLEALEWPRERLDWEAGIWIERWGSEQTCDYGRCRC